MYTTVQIGRENPTSFLINAQLKKHSEEVPIKALCDTGAEARLLVSPSVAQRAVEQLGARLKKLKRPITLTDYRQQEAGRITYILKTSLCVDGRTFPDE